MPYLMIRTNREVTAEAGQELLDRASSVTAEQLGKPERFVMVSLETGTPMRFGGSDAPTVYLELKSIGLPADRTAALSAALSGLMDEMLDVGSDRVYIEFADAERHMWGWKGGTF